MPDTAFEAGRKWKQGVVRDRLGWAMGRLMRHLANPGDLGEVPGDIDLIDRYVDELKTLDGHDKGKAFDLIRRNLENAIAFARERLARLNGFFAGQEHIFPNGEAMAEERRTIEDLERKLRALEKEGRPGG